MKEHISLFMKTFLFILLLLLAVPSVLAAENNKFGIHLAVPANEQIEKAAELVNENGGDWGYITLVIQENDRNHEKWQEIFNKLRELHLIPIIRIATTPQGPVWRKPSKEDADKWVEFLNGLNWVVKDRYVILFNETNHGQEWGGSVDPVHFAQVTKVFAEKLEAKNADFFVMLGGFDASAPAAPPSYADEAQYFKTVIDTIGVQDFNRLFSGLSSHSYPNPGFAGSPYGSGRGSVRTYEWELELLKSWGVKQLPVFITETGWDARAISREVIANYLQQAFSSIWLPDNKVKAVTPFVLDYQGDPFLGFSWRHMGSDSYYSQFFAVQSMEKKKGDPVIIQKGGISFNLPKEFVVNSNYHFKIDLKNTGQAVWDEKYEYKLVLENFESGYFFSDLGTVKPHQNMEVDLFLKSGNKPGKKSSKVILMQGNKKILESATWDHEIIPLPNLSFKVDLFPRIKDNGDDFEIQVFDEKEELVFKKYGIKVDRSKGGISEIRNIALGKKYRVVILKPYYLPRQKHVLFKRGSNGVIFERMLPLDFDKDGNFDFNDIWTLITKPSLFSLLLP